MSGARLLLLLSLLLLSAGRSAAQTRPDPAVPATPQKELTVHLTLPTVVGLIGEYAGILTSKEKGKLKTLSKQGRSTTSNPVLILTIPLPRVWADRKVKAK
ncbi:hypothetical protein HNQ93_002052 [Hymenobacter luteus]|uniref:Uncharacterized protein n=2 Tax=Hymenobacter TaxID=89966 RepID=A0A7W9T098_9BACT|nr:MULTISPECIES: hypothetical protein [Hymenobacter]MBB4600587.1 hypothetical protein [Hymenobacter latericoloratus]MBB6059206.1 hypothetical protein [Hymenobacter luteus]